MCSPGEGDELGTVQELKACACGWQVVEGKEERSQDGAGQVVWLFAAHVQRRWSKIHSMPKFSRLKKGTL